MECSPPGFSVHRISQARILEWVATSFSCGSSQPSNWTSASCIGMWIVYCWATRKALSFPPLSRFPVSHSMLAVSGFATWVYYLWSNGHLHSLIQDTFAYWWKTMMVMKTATVSTLVPGPAPPPQPYLPSTQLPRLTNSQSSPERLLRAKLSSPVLTFKSA